MNKILLISILSIFFASCTSSIEGEGAATSKKSYTIDEITNVDISCNCNVTILTGSEVGVKVESRQNIIDNLNVKAKNGKLVIDESKQVADFSAYDIFIYVTRQLNKVELKKQTVFNVSGTLTVDDLDLSAVDQVKVDNINIFTNNLKLTVKDQAFVSLKGSAIALIYKGSNQSQGYLFDFETNDAQINTNDNAILEINSKKSLLGSVKGNSIVTYMGDPRKDTKVSDNAQVVKK